jgi:hypothetical protein
LSIENAQVTRGGWWREGYRAGRGGGRDGRREGGWAERRKRVWEGGMGGKGGSGREGGKRGVWIYVKGGYYVRVRCVQRKRQG